MNFNLPSVMALQNDTLDKICWRVYGKTSGVTEQVLAANPQLDLSSPILAMGTRVYLPAIKPTQKESIALWD
ncbi:tail protein X [Alteromonas sp. a30]|uniref:tail protein X n=1 Tax=Alteromonas sp. a30 TaxID=2730917 RepID=UPI0022821226|nr:tail protein X [Alteromonas sp. a30]MCY7297482.1 phage tail protein [Alteromonas sp. a30]